MGQEKKLEAAVQSGSVLQAPKFAEPKVAVKFKHFERDSSQRERERRIVTEKGRKGQWAVWEGGHAADKDLGLVSVLLKQVKGSLADFVTLITGMSRDGGLQKEVPRACTSSGGVWQRRGGCGNADNGMMRHQLSELGVDTAKMPLGDIQQRTIDAGFQALAELEVCQNRPTHCVGHMSVAHAKLKLPFSVLKLPSFVSSLSGSSVSV